MKILAGLGLAVFALSLATAAYGQQVPIPGITVSGSASLNATADSIAFNLRLATRNTQTKITDQMLAPIEDALRRAGANSKGIVHPQLFSTRPVTVTILRGTLDAPTPEKLRAGTELLANTFATNPDLLLQDGSIVTSLDDCQALRFRAEAAALRDAQTRATRLAKISGVSIGRLVALTSNMIYGGPDAIGCKTGYSLSELATNPAFDIERFLNVNIFATVSATYSIR